MRRVRGHLGQQEQHLEGAFNARDASRGMYETNTETSLQHRGRTLINHTAELNIIQKYYNLLCIAP